MSQKHSLSLSVQKAEQQNNPQLNLRFLIIMYVDNFKKGYWFKNKAKNYLE